MMKYLWQYDVEGKTCLRIEGSLKEGTLPTWVYLFDVAHPTKILYQSGTEHKLTAKSNNDAVSGHTKKANGGEHQAFDLEENKLVWFFKPVPPSVDDQKELEFYANRLDKYPKMQPIFPKFGGLIELNGKLYMMLEKAVEKVKNDEDNSVYTIDIKIGSDASDGNGLAKKGKNLRLNYIYPARKECGFMSEN